MYQNGFRSRSGLSRGIQNGINIAARLRFGAAAQHNLGLYT